MKLGDRLKKLIDENDISQKKIANDLNLAVSTLNGYVKNHREPDYETLKRIATYFDVTTDYLLNTNSYKLHDKELNVNQIELLQLFDLLTPEQQEFIIEQEKIYIKHNKK